jgi:hypothetical protein
LRFLLRSDSAAHYGLAILSHLHELRLHLLMADNQRERFSFHEKGLKIKLMR